MKPLPGMSHNTKRLRRYPRFFEIELPNNGRGNGPVAEYDLYEIGVQRNQTTVEFEVSSTVTTAISVVSRLTQQAVANQGMRYAIPQANYDIQNDKPGEGVTLRFEGPSCVLRIYRPSLKPDDGEGSPPPPDPGDDHVELP